MRTAILAAILAGSTATAQSAMTEREFDAYATGYAITYQTVATGIIATEEYYPGNRVRWQVEGGECLDGTWYAAGRDICFLYEERTTPVCWQMIPTDGGITVYPGQNNVYEAWISINRTKEELSCAPDGYVGSSN